MSQSIARKFLSVLKHGGPFRALKILYERKIQGHSTLAITYSWPKKISFQSIDRESLTHFFIPHLNAQKAYGGIASLVYWAVFWARKGEKIHFVICDHGGSKEEIPKIAKLDPEDWKNLEAQFQVSDFSNIQEIFLTIDLKKDFFVASSWWTKVSLDQSQIPLSAENLTYIIQDYEALFYDPNDAIEGKLKKLAEQSYQGSYAALINSQFLADFLVQKKIIGKNPSQVFAPLIDTKVFFQDPSQKKEKILFVYARPDVRRNRFDLCLEALQKAAPLIPKDWVLMGAGTLKNSVFLGFGHTLKAIGKLDFEAYAALIRKSSVGLSLMESPHPSYPPLELSQSGAQVVCNQYENKNYEVLGPEFFCAPLDSFALSQKLKEALIKAQSNFLKSQEEFPHLLSVIVRTHNENQFKKLQEALESLALSDYPKIEIVLVCKNPTSSYKQKLSDKLKRLSQLRTGLSFQILELSADPNLDTRSKSLNLGLQNSKGRFVAFLDYDDLVDSRLYSTLINDLLIDSPNCVLSAAGCEVRDLRENGELIQSLRPFSWAQSPADLYYENFLPIHSFVLEKSRISPDDLFFQEELELYEDYEFLLRLGSKYPFSLKHLTKYFAFYRVFLGDQSHSNPSLSQQKNQALQEKHKKNDLLVQKTRDQFFPPQHPLRVEAEKKGPRFKGHPLKKFLRPLFKKFPKSEKFFSHLAAFFGYKARRF